MNNQVNIQKNLNINEKPVKVVSNGKIHKHNIDNWKTLRRNDKNQQTLENIITENSLKTLNVNRNTSQSHNHIFSNRVLPRLPITNQKSSGRCWLFAALNVVRREMIEKYELKDFEFSQSYLFFWDKLERFNYNLDVIIKNKELDIDDQLLRHILSDPISDGGQWDMIVNIVEKYGLIPKSSYGESFHSSRSNEMNTILKKKFRKSAYELRKSKNPIKDKEDIIRDVYGILCNFLGTPPDTFTWEYYDKEETYHQMDKLNPLDFYHNHVPFNFRDYVCVIHDPREKNPYNSLFTVKYLGNMVGGNPVLYLNLEIKKIKEFIEKTINDNKAVWFGCDVGQNLHRGKCAMDFDLVDNSGLFNTNLDMDKEARLLSKESLMTHAMCITGFNRIDDYHHIIDKWQVENSWGKSDAADGYYIMTDKWFDEYVYEIAIHKKYLSEKENEILKSNKITTLPPWDPMGSLASI